MVGNIKNSLLNRYILYFLNINWIFLYYISKNEKFFIFFLDIFAKILAILAIFISVLLSHLFNKRVKSF